MGRRTTKKDEAVVKKPKEKKVKLAGRPAEQPANPIPDRPTEADSRDVAAEKLSRQQRRRKIVFGLILWTSHIVSHTRTWTTMGECFRSPRR